MEKRQFSKLSIVVPVYNEEAYLEAVIRKVVLQSLPGGLDREVILINDGSTDGTEEMVKAKDKFSVKEIADMQNDTGSHTAKRFIPIISKACSKDDSLKPYISMLEKWDRFISIESHEATLFNSLNAVLLAHVTFFLL